MKNYFTLHRRSILFCSVLAIWLVGLSSQIVQAQVNHIPFPYDPALAKAPVCASARVYVYEPLTGAFSFKGVSGSNFATNPLDFQLSGGGSMAGKSLADALSTGRFIGVEEGWLVFANASGVPEYYNNTSGVFGFTTLGGNTLKPLNGTADILFGALGDEPHAGEKFRSNPKFIDMDINQAVMLDADGSISYYLYGAQSNVAGYCSTSASLVAGGDYTWKNYTNIYLPALISPGVLDGQAIDPKKILAVENGYIYAVNPVSNSLDLYTASTGIYFASGNGVNPALGVVGFPTFTGGVSLNGKTLSAATSNSVPGVTFLGIGGGLIVFYDANIGKIITYAYGTLFGYVEGAATLTAGAIPAFGPSQYGGSPASTVLDKTKFYGVSGNEIVFLDDNDFLEHYNYWTGLGIVETNWQYLGSPQSGKPVTNANLIEVTNLGAMYLDDNGTLSYYEFTNNTPYSAGALSYDYTWKKYIGGPASLDGQTLSKSNILSAAWPILYAIGADGKIASYNVCSGHFIANQSPTLTGGAIDGKSASDAVQNKIPGVTFLGNGDGFWVFAVCEEQIAVTKGVVAVTNAPPSNAIAEYEMVIENTGSADLKNVTLLDNLAAQMGCAFVSIVSAPTITASTATTAPTVNAGFNGSTNTNLFNGTSGLLKAGEKVTVRFKARLNPNCSAAPIANVAQVSATGTGAGATPLPLSPSTAPKVGPGSGVGGAAGGCPGPLMPLAVTGDQTICQDGTTNTAPVNIPFVVPAALQPGHWTGGTGTFANAASPTNPGYSPGASEYNPAMGIQTVILTWVPNVVDPCVAADLSVVVTVNHKPILNIPNSGTVCNATTLNMSSLGATITNNASTVTNGTWTSSSGGAFTAGGRFLSNPVYTLTPTDISTGSVVFTLTSDAVAPCGVVMTSVTINVITLPANQTVCENSPAPLSITSIPAYKIGQWVGGTGTFTPNRQTANATYTPSATEFDEVAAIETVTLTWVPTSFPSCLAPSTGLTTVITINHKPKIVAGNPVMACNGGTINLSDLGASITNNVSGIAGGTWTTSGDGVFLPNNTSTHPFATAITYVPGPNDQANGTATLTLTSGTPAPPCNTPVSSSVNVYFTKQKIALGLLPDCTRNLTEADLGAAPGSIITMRKPNLPATSLRPFTRDDIGQEFEIMIMFGNKMCISYVKFIDNTAPSLSAIPTATIRCTDIVNGKAPIPGAVVNGGSTRMPEPYSLNTSVVMTPTASQTNPVWTPTSSSATPTRVRFGVQDCSDFAVTYEDVVNSSISCNGDIIPTQITRRWRFKDIFGNESFFNQTINVVRGVLRFPAASGDCTADASKTGLPFIDFNGDNVKQDSEPLATSGAVCGISVAMTSEVVMPTCPSSKMITREWKITDCGSFSTFTQVFNLNDITPPQAVLSFTDYGRVPQEMCSVMIRELPDGRKDTLPMRSFVYTTAKNVVNTTLTGASNVVKLTPLMRSNQCGVVDIAMTLTPSDPSCSNGNVTASIRNANLGAGNAVSFNGMATMTVAGGTPITVIGRASELTTRDNSFEIVLTDPCGNQQIIKVLVVIIDNVGPTTLCEDKELTLNNAGQAVINTGYYFNDWTTDNCNYGTPTPPSPNSQTWIKRKSETCWSNNLILTCNNLGYDSLDIRNVDMMGNYTDCCIRVNLRNKNAPVCPMMPLKERLCTSTDLQNLDAFVWDSPVGTAVCGPLTVKPDALTLTLSCGAGDVTKHWVITDNMGRSADCYQRLIVSPVLGYRVTVLPSQTTECVPAVADDRDAILRSILQRVSAADNRATCSAPVLKITDMVFSSTDYCKRIMRTYELRDLCNGAGGACTDLGEVTTDFATFNYYAPASGCITWTRNITILDKTPAVVRVETEKVKCVVDNTCVGTPDAIVLSATDNCGSITIPVAGGTPNSYLYLFYRWELRVGSPTGSLYSSAATGSGSGTGTSAPNAFTITPTTTNTLVNLPLGIYYITYVVVDDCGNVAQGTPIKITIKDCKSPYINTHNKNTVLAYRTDANGLGQGMSQVCVSEVLNALSDNCTDSATLLSKLRFVRAAGSTTYPASIVNGNCIMFTCADLANSPIACQVWTVDNSGNAIFNVVDIKVEDTNRACSTPQSIVTGSLKTENSQAAKSVTMTSTTAGTISNTSTTDADGAYTLAAGAVGGNYVLKASKQLTDDKYTGVTTFDIARISKHILDIENFTSPYQAIAADVNRDNVIDAIDMVTIRNFILRKTSSLPGGVWRFVDKSYTFRNPANPFGEDFPEVINLSAAKSNETANFVAVKLGDVNATFVANAAPTTVRGDKSLVLNVEDMDLVAGNEYTVNVSAKNFNAASFQGTFGIANASIKSVKAGDLANYGDGNFALFANEFTTSWNGKTQASADVFTVSFVANKSAKLSDVMTVGSALTPAVANDAQGTEMNVSLKFNTGKVKGGEFALHAATPNPVSTETNIGFVVPKDGAAKMTIYTVEGKVLVVKNIDAKAGLNNVTVTKSELNASGVMYYRLETADNSATKKMIVIE
jgi:Dockerin type I domain